MIEQRGISVNDVKITPSGTICLTKENFNDGFIIMKKGKKVYHKDFVGLIYGTNREKIWNFVACCAHATLGLVLIVFAYLDYFRLEKTLSWCDMNQQVVPFVVDFKNILSGQSNLFLNMSNAGGTSFWGILLFFISSPFIFS